MASEADADLRRFRERIAGGIALAVVLIGCVVIILALRYTENAEVYARVKDLLQTIFPLLTFVLGYYFNKTSTEARAEKAEAVADKAVATAHTATEERKEAQAKTDQVRSEMREVKSLLQDMSETAERVVEQGPQGAPGLLGVDDQGIGQTEDPRLELRVLLARAKRALSE
jgi:hypothetical protein